MRTTFELRVVADGEALCKAAAQEFLDCATNAVQNHGRFTVALSGGSTPRKLFSKLATDDSLTKQMPWAQTHFFWGDERHVPPDHSDSNFRMANEAMLSIAPVPQENIHRIRAENPDAATAASEYEEEIRSFFQLKDNKFPRFDLVLLGIGPEAHTASLFPGTKALNETEKIVVSNWVGKFFTDRITFTFPAINNAAGVIFLVGGADKALALKGVLEGPHEPAQLPAQGVMPDHGRLLWLVEHDAAQLLQN